MKKFLLAGVCSATLALVGTQNANAADYDPAPVWSPDWYVSVFGGAAFTESYDFDFVAGGGTSFPYKLTFDTGFIVGGAVGIEFIPGLRGEVEFAYQENSNDQLTGAAFSANESGDIEAVTVMANIWYDLDLNMMVTPYVGGGLGVGFVDGTASDVTPTFSGDDTVLAFQLGAGLSFGVSDAIDFVVGYRFRGLVDVEFSSTTAGFSIDEGNLYSHIVHAGITVRLNGM